MKYKMSRLQSVLFILAVVLLMSPILIAAVSPSYTTVNLRSSRWNQDSGTGTLKAWMKGMEDTLNAGGTFAGGTITSDVTMTNGEYIRTSTTTAHASAIQDYDVDGTSWRNVLSFTNGNTPANVLGSTYSTLAIASSGGLNVSTSGAVTGVSTFTSTGDYTAGADGVEFKADTTTAHTIGIDTYDVDGTTYRHALLATNGNTPAVVLGNAYSTLAITSTVFNVDTSGNLSGVASASYTGGAKVYNDLVSISNAEVKTLYSAPKVLVAAPGAHYVVDLISAVLLYDYASAGFNTAANNLSIEYKADASGATASGTISQTGFIDQTADMVAKLIPVGQAATAVAGIENQPLVLYCATADPTTGGGTMRVQISYRIVPTGF